VESLGSGPGRPIPGRPSVAIVVVHYGAWDPTRSAVQSLAAAQPDGSIVVVDNGPGPAPGDLGARIVVVPTPRNLGFGAACNLGASAAAGNVLVFANNDVCVDGGTIALLVDRLAADTGLAAAGPRFLDEAGKPGPSVKKPPTPWRILGENLFLPRLLAPFPVGAGESRPREVDTLFGALFAIRRDAFESAGGFDEGYFFYAEETDLFARLRRLGWRLAYEPGSVAMHVGGLASRNFDQATRDRWMRDGLLRYAERFHGTFGRRITSVALSAGAVLRWTLSWIPGLRDQRARRSRYAAALRDIVRRARTSRAAGPPA